MQAFPSLFRSVVALSLQISFIIIVTLLDCRHKIVSHFDVNVKLQTDFMGWT